MSVTPGQPKVPASQEDRTIQAGPCREFMSTLLAKLGADPGRAARWAELLVETSLLGLDSHGVAMLERYINNMIDGGIDLQAQPVMVSDNGASVVMDGRAGAGHLTAEAATRLAIERSWQYGLACVAVRRANHVGACGLYVRQAAAADCIGLCTAVSRPGIAPWGGIEAMVGINPLAFAAPIDGRPPFMLDMAASIAAMGKITKAKDLGQPIPHGWAMDHLGRVTTDPAAAMVGSLIPIGEHKGYGLAMVMEILAGLLSGGALAGEVKSWVIQTAEPTNAGFTVLVLRLAVFGDPAAFKQRMRSWVEQMASATRRPGFERIYYPGQPEGETYQQRLRDGIPLEPIDREMFHRLATRFKVDLRC